MGLRTLFSLWILFYRSECISSRDFFSFAKCCVVQMSPVTLPPHTDCFVLCDPIVFCVCKMRCAPLHEYRLLPVYWHRFGALVLVLVYAMLCRAVLCCVEHVQSHQDFVYARTVVVVAHFVLVCLLVCIWMFETCQTIHICCMRSADSMLKNAILIRARCVNVYV